MNGKIMATDNTLPQRITSQGRGEKLIAAVHAATLTLLEERGYDAMEIPEIAERAGVNKTSIYRRWPTKSELVLDVALARMRIDVPVFDTGNFQHDLTALLKAIVTILKAPFASELLRVLMSRGINDPTIRALNTKFWEERFSTSAQIVEKAIQRKELAIGTDARLLLEFAASPLYFRWLVLAKPVTDEDIEQIVRLVMRTFS
ncbi:TetR/AcrR family transcriptional regulator [Agitococcus lubricus]|uniref:TetR family transcriptional regulator n=1 Tax=Agitococcus lubricus TaxID=1077255 RepID=A0A2T5J272_9GAMM|nr:TetR/AcrR family transcriptional regulator [Agitococcus lubricus]PTQ90611.1 TetR family transcriptional regulator [Agitococcus lubricus]